MNNIERYKLKDIGKWEDRIYDYKPDLKGGAGEEPELLINPAEALSTYVEISLLLSGLGESIKIRRLDPFSEEDERLVAGYYKATDEDRKIDHTLPILVDKKRGRILSNDPFAIVESFETVLSDKSDLRTEEALKLNHEIFQNLYMEGYRAGFAEDQIEYDEGYQAVFLELDVLEERLSDKKYLTGDRLSDADVLLYAFLVRFDIQYVAAFRINRNLLRDMPNLWAYAKRLHRLEHFGDRIDFEAIKKYAFLKTVVTNPHNKLPLGPGTEYWEN